MFLLAYNYRLRSFVMHVHIVYQSSKQANYVAHNASINNFYKQLHQTPDANLYIQRLSITQSLTRGGIVAHAFWY